MGPLAEGAGQVAVQVAQGERLGVVAVELPQDGLGVVAALAAVGWGRHHVVDAAGVALEVGQEAARVGDGPRRHLGDVGGVAGGVGGQLQEVEDQGDPAGVLLELGPRAGERAGELEGSLLGVVGVDQGGPGPLRVGGEVGDVGRGPRVLDPQAPGPQAADDLGPRGGDGRRDAVFAPAGLGDRVGVGEQEAVDEAVVAAPGRRGASGSCRGPCRRRGRGTGGRRGSGRWRRSPCGRRRGPARTRWRGTTGVRSPCRRGAGSSRR